MKNEIIEIIHKLSTENAGIYTCIFGYDGFDILKEIEINWAFKLSNNLDNDIKMFIDYLIVTILNNYDIRIINQLNNKINYLNIEYDNLFVKDNGFNMKQISQISDLENTIDDIQISQISDFVCIKLSVPIYKIQF